MSGDTKISGSLGIQVTRKQWWASWKVRCCWLADIWPVSAGFMQLMGQWRAAKDLEVNEMYVWLAMLPWLTLAFGEIFHDGIKLWQRR